MVEEGAMVFKRQMTQQDFMNDLKRKGFDPLQTNQVMSNINNFVSGKKFQLIGDPSVQSSSQAIMNNWPTQWSARGKEVKPISTLNMNEYQNIMLGVRKTSAPDIVARQELIKPTYFAAKVFASGEEGTAFRILSKNSQIPVSSFGDLVRFVNTNKDIIVQNISTGEQIKSSPMEMTRTINSLVAQGESIKVKGLPKVTL